MSFWHVPGCNEKNHERPQILNQGPFECCPLDSDVQVSGTKGLKKTRSGSLGRDLKRVPSAAHGVNPLMNALLCFDQSCRQNILMGILGVILEL